MSGPAEEGWAGGSGGVDLSVEVAGIRMKNPVMAASGTIGYGRPYARYVDLNRLGAVVVKGTSLEPWPGNPPPRMAETPCGMLNAIGLENPGVEAVIRNELPFLAALQVPVIVNIVGRTEEEYAAVARRLDEASRNGGNGWTPAGLPSIAGLELNISCPNVKEGGMAFGTSPEMAARVVRAVKGETGLPVIVKLSPNVTSVVDIALSVEEAGADAISLINTLLGMAIDVERRRPVLANVFGGLSGPAVKPVALRMVWQVAEAVRVPVIGMGGISTTRDALEFILAGATAVAVGTATFVNPAATVEIIEGLEAYLLNNGISSLRELVGAARRHEA